MENLPSLFFPIPSKKKRACAKKSETIKDQKEREIVNVQPTSSHYNYVSNPGCHAVKAYCATARYMYAMQRPSDGRKKEGGAYAILTGIKKKAR